MIEILFAITLGISIFFITFTMLKIPKREPFIWRMNSNIPKFEIDNLLSSITYGIDNVLEAPKTVSRKGSS